MTPRVCNYFILFIYVSKQILILSLFVNEKYDILQLLSLQAVEVI